MNDERRYQQTDLPEGDETEQELDPVEIASDDSFPASDPPSWSGGVSQKDEDVST